MRKRSWLLVLALCVASGWGAVKLCCTHTMTLEEAIALLGREGLTPAQRKVATSAIGRRANEAARMLLALAAEPDGVGMEAAIRLNQLREILR